MRTKAHIYECDRAECAERICAIQPRGSGVGKVKFRRDAYQKFKGLAEALRDMHYVVELKGNVRS